MVFVDNGNDDFNWTMLRDVSWTPRKQLRGIYAEGVTDRTLIGRFYHSDSATIIGMMEFCSWDNADDDNNNERRESNLSM